MARPKHAPKVYLSVEKTCEASFRQKYLEKLGFASERLFDEAIRYRVYQEDGIYSFDNPDFRKVYISKRQIIEDEISEHYFKEVVFPLLKVILKDTKATYIDTISTSKKNNAWLRPSYSNRCIMIFEGDFNDFKEKVLESDPIITLRQTAPSNSYYYKFEDWDNLMKKEIEEGNL